MPISRESIPQALRSQLVEAALRGDFSTFGSRIVGGNLEFGLESSTSPSFAECRVGAELADISLSNGRDIMLIDSDEDIGSKSRVLGYVFDVFVAFSRNDFILESNWLGLPRLYIRAGEHGLVEAKPSRSPFWYHADGPIVRAKSRALSIQAWPALEALGSLPRQAAVGGAEAWVVWLNGRYVDVHLSLMGSVQGLRLSWRYDLNSASTTFSIQGGSIASRGTQLSNISWEELGELVNSIVRAGIRVTLKGWPSGNRYVSRLDMLQSDSSFAFEIPPWLAPAPPRQIWWRP